MYNVLLTVNFVTSFFGRHSLRFGPITMVTKKKWKSGAFLPAFKVVKKVFVSPFFNLAEPKFSCY